MASASASGGGGAWRPSGVVTLLTDFGLADAYVGILKGVLLARCPQARPVDLSHGVTPQRPLHGAWLLASAWRYFPAGTVHVAVVDPGVGSARRILVARDEGHVFLAPDNGLLGPVLSARAELFALDVERFALPGRSATFHGRDVFAPAAAALASGLEPDAMGPPAGDWRRARFPAVEEAAGELRTEVLYVDRFGNLVTPLAGERLDGDRGTWTVRVGDAELPVLRTYADVEPGRPLALVGSAGSLEVSVRDGDAARMLDAAAGSRVVARRRTVT